MDFREFLEQLRPEHVIHLCGIEDTIAQLKAEISKMPAETSEPHDVFNWGLERLQKLADEGKKEARKMELELEIRMIDNPIDTETVEGQHSQLHCDAEQLGVEHRRRQAAAWQAFVDLVRRRV